MEKKVQYYLSLALVCFATGCTGYGLLATSQYTAEAAAFNGGIPNTQNVAALQKQVVVTGLQNEIVKNNADSQHAVLGVADHRLGVEGHAEKNRHDSIRNRINEVRGTTSAVWGITDFIRSF